MALKTVIRRTTRIGLGAGILVAYHQSGLWKDSGETIQNYEKIKKATDGYLNAVPVVKDIYRDLSKFTGNVLSPVTERVTTFKRDWLTYDLSWATNKDGIIKPTWNKGVEITFDFIAHSPETIKNWSIIGWNKMSEFINSDETQTTTVTATTTNSQQESQSKATTSTPAPSPSVNQ